MKKIKTIDGYHRKIYLAQIGIESIQSNPYHNKELAKIGITRLKFIMLMSKIKLQKLIIKELRGKK